VSDDAKQTADPWSEAVGAWVPLASLADTVARELGVSSIEASKILRGPLESGCIETRVVGWEGDPWWGPPRECDKWVNDARQLGAVFVAVSDAGWQHVAWTSGAIAGCRIDVLWQHVLEQLNAPTALLMRQLLKEAKEEAAVSAGEKRSAPQGGRPPKYDWDAFWIEIAIYAALNNLEEGHRSELQTHMMKWAAEHWADPPEDATIRGRLRKLYEAARGRT
jgi:hypothetical protein